MKSIVKIFFCCFLIIVGSKALISQNPDFEFYIAFEDSSGAKDTVWAVWDSTANTFPGIYDTAWGEFPDSLPEDTSFRVYIKYNVTDSGKVRAEPTSNPCSNSFNIWAVNYTYPIKVTWDTALFKQDPILFDPYRATFQNDYFFMNWNDGNFPNEYNMLIVDTVELQPFAWGSQDHFPISFQIESFVVGIEESFDLESVKLFPNPTNEILNISFKKDIINFDLTIINSIGKKELQFDNLRNPVQIKLVDLAKGLYFIRIEIDDKFIVKPLLKY